VSAQNARFVADVDRWVGRTKQVMLDKSKAIVREVFIRVVRRTPVASGRLRGSWGLGINVPDEVRNELDATGSVTISFMSSKLAQAKLGDNMIIYNPQPYARRIEYGYSKKAPQGMVRITMAEIPQIARQVAKQ
jgi:hypothetical protein